MAETAFRTESNYRQKPRVRVPRFAAVVLIAICVAAQTGTERYRPQYHFSPRVHWTNDPNGLVYFEGEYHLFFQYNPFGDNWGHMSWGHAVSRDLVHWSELPVALREENGIMIFTGSVVIDENNSSGFCTGQKPCMVAVYTGHTPEHDGKPALQTQNLAYSNDRGRTWTKYNGNPVIDLHQSDFRDPKAFWSTARKEWVMAVALPNDHKVVFFHSADLKHWTKMSEFGPAGAISGQWECPELFQARLSNASGADRWVLKIGLNPGALQGGSGEQYFVGSFDGTKFTNENPSDKSMWTDYGKDCYCALTFNHLPPERNPIALGWMDNWQYAADLPTAPPWRGQMTVPREVRLRETSDGLRLVQDAIPALATLREKERALRGKDIARLNRDLASDANGLSHSSEAEVSVHLGTANKISLSLAGMVIQYDRASKKISIDRRHAGQVDFSSKFPAVVEGPIEFPDSMLDLRLLLDRNSLELFGNSGLLTMTMLMFPPPGPFHLQLASEGGAPSDVQIKLYDLRSAQ